MLEIRNITVLAILFTKAVGLALLLAMLRRAKPLALDFLALLT